MQLPAISRPRPNEQRKVEQLLLKLATLKEPISAKPAPIASGKTVFNEIGRAHV